MTVLGGENRDKGEEKSQSKEGYRFREQRNKNLQIGRGPKNLSECLKDPT